MSVYHPTYRAIPIDRGQTPADLVFDPPLDGIVVSAAGTVIFDNDVGDEVTYTHPQSTSAEGEEGTVPFTLWAVITRLDKDGTVPDEGLVGLQRI